MKPGLYAVFASGRRARVDERYGDTIEQLVEKLTVDSLTGSAVPLHDAVIVLSDGGQTRYGDVQAFEVRQ